MATKKKVAPENFEAALQQLDEIVQQLEKGELPLNEALEAFKTGITLSQFCQKTLNEAETTVAKMMTAEGEILLDEESAS